MNGKSQLSIINPCGGLTIVDLGFAGLAAGGRHLHGLFHLLGPYGLLRLPGRSEGPSGSQTPAINHQS